MTTTPFQKEAWIEYGIGVVVILFRIFARIKVVGIKNWQGDDYFSVVALIFWTVCNGYWDRMRKPRELTPSG